MTQFTRKTPPDYTPYTDDAPLRAPRRSAFRRVWTHVATHGDTLLTVAAIVAGTVTALGLLGATVSSPRDALVAHEARLDTLERTVRFLDREHQGLRAGIDFLVRRQCLAMTPVERASQAVCDGLPVPTPASYLPRPNARPNARSTAGGIR